MLGAQRAFVAFFLFFVAAAGIADPTIQVATGHDGGITALSASDDGSLVLSFDGSVWSPGSAIVWDAASGREIHRVGPERVAASFAVLSPDGRYIAFGGHENNPSVILYEIRTGRRVLEMQTPETVDRPHTIATDETPGTTSMAFSQDGRYLVTVRADFFDYTKDEGFAELWDLQRGERVRLLDGRINGNSDLRISADGSRVLAVSGFKTEQSAQTGGVIHVWELGGGNELARILDTVINYRSATFLDDGGTTIIAGTDDGRLARFDLRSGTRPTWIGPVVPDPDDRGGQAISSVVPEVGGESVLLQHVEGQILRADVRTGAAAVVRDVLPAFWFWGPRFSLLDDDTLLTAGGGLPLLLSLSGTSSDRLFAGSADIAAVSASVRSPVPILVSHSDGWSATISAATGRPDFSAVDYPRARSGNVEARAEQESLVVTVTDTRSGATIGRFEVENPVVRLELSHDARFLAVTHGEHHPRGWGWPNKGMSVFDLNSGEELFRADNHSNPPRMHFTPDSRFLITTQQTDFEGYKLELAVVHELPSGEVRYTIGNDGKDGFGFNAIDELAISPDGRIAATWDGEIVFFEIETGEIFARTERRSMPAHGLSFSPSGRTLAADSGGDILVIDVATAKIRTVIAGAHEGAIWGLSFANEEIIQSWAGSTIKQWSAATGEHLTTTALTPEKGWVTWTPEGFFTGTDRAIASLVYIQDGLDTYPIDQFFELFYRPDVVEAKLAGRDITRLADVRSISEVFARPPEVTLSIEPAGDEARVRVVATDRGGGAQAIRLFHNGARVLGEGRGLSVVARPGAADGGGGELVREFVIRLVDGENTFRAVAFSNTQIESTPATARLQYAAAQVIEPTLWLLSIGINEYRNPRYNLNYAVGDSRAFTGALEAAGAGLFGEVTVTSIEDREATKARITSALDSIAAAARPEDVFVFFYAGHGVAPVTDSGTDEFYYVPSDVTQMTRPELLAELALSGSEFAELVSAIPARKQLLVIDACNSGAIGQAFGYRGAAEERALARLSRSAGTAILAASRDDQFAQEFDALGQGALTRAFLDGLAGNASAGDDEITVGELFVYVDQALPELTEQYAGQPQFPQVFRNGQDFPIGLR